MRFETVAGSLEHFAGRVDSLLAQKPLVSVLVLAVPFLACAVLQAGHRPFWFDEILTEYISALPSLDAIWKTLAARAESTPPLLHIVTKLSGTAFGWSAFGLRLPAIAGYLTMMLCVYFSLRHYTGPLYAAIGALAGYMTLAAPYATQVRPYGLLLGCTAIALVCWQQAARDRMRALTLTGLCLSLAAAQSVHYYAILSFASIGAGEAVRTSRTRRIDWPIWVALGLALLPLLLFAPLVRANMALRDGYFSAATLPNFKASLLETYHPGRDALAAAFMAVAALCAPFNGRRRTPETGAAFPPAHELAAWSTLFLAPPFAFIAGLLVTKVVVARYSLVTVIGFSLLLPLLLQRIFLRSRAAALALFLVLASGAWYALKPVVPGLNAGSLAPWLTQSDPEHLPIVVVDPLLYLPLAHNTTGEITRDLVFIAEPAEALKYTGRNTGNHNLAGLRLTGRLNLPTYVSFTRSHSRFLLLWSDSPSDWIAPKLRDDGATLVLRSYNGPGVLFLVDLPQRPRSLPDNWAR